MEGPVCLILGIILGTVFGWVIWGADDSEAEFRGACESRGGHVLYIDHDNKACIRNGEVVEIHG